VGEYWVVNLVDRLIEVHTEPRDGLYRQIRRCAIGDDVKLTRFADVRVAVSDVLRK
jgi:hypothetical protein